MGDPLAADAYDWDLVLDDPVAPEDVFPLTYALRKPCCTRSFWKPVGTGLHEDGDVDRVFHEVFAPHPEQVAKMDNAINRIPGLEKLDCLAHTMVSV